MYSLLLFRTNALAMVITPNLTAHDLYAYDEWTRDNPDEDVWPVSWTERGMGKITNLFHQHLAHTEITPLEKTPKAVQDFAQNAFDPMDGVINYQISTQLKTKRLASKEVWRRHHKKYVSSFDKQHEEDFDDDFDWTDDFEEYAALTGAFVHEFE